MSSIGIIANPASGKDIRRLVSYATTIDNQEKVNIVKRIVLAAQSMGTDHFYFMPDSFQFGWVVVDDLTIDGRLTANCEVLQIPYRQSQEDTVNSARIMEEMGVGCIVILGGDGTSRAAAKSVHDTPILPVSTGTNNVYPQMTEGTVAGMAAGLIAGMRDPESCCIRDKRIEIWRNGELLDIALIDAVISDDLWVGSRAIWDPEKIERVFVTRCHPASIGFSAAAGCMGVVTEEEDRGLMILLRGSEKKNQIPKWSVKAPIAAGMLTDLDVLERRELPVGVPYEYKVRKNCMIALDGEREVRANAGESLTFVITRNGPLRVKIRETLEEGVRRGLFNR